MHPGLKMKTWIETSWIYQTFGQTCKTESSDTKFWNQGITQTNYFEPDYEALKRALSTISDHCNKTQMTIKSIFPLTSARTHTFGQALEYSVHPAGTSAAGIGFGWGFSNVVGVAALLERVEEISDEEYKQRPAEVPSRAIAPAFA